MSCTIPKTNGGFSRTDRAPHAKSGEEEGPPWTHAARIDCRITGSYWSQK